MYLYGRVMLIENVQRFADIANKLYIYIYIYIFVNLQLGFSPVAAVQHSNRQVTYITHKHNTKTQQ
jgi:hypothetical protein